jgi:5-methylthioribose kinase
VSASTGSAERDITATILRHVQFVSHKIWRCDLSVGDNAVCFFEDRGMFRNNILFLSSEYKKTPRKKPALNRQNAEPEACRFKLVYS